jgi:hypothetical protein
MDLCNTSKTDFQKQTSLGCPFESAVQPQLWPGQEKGNHGLEFVYTRVRLVAAFYLANAPAADSAAVHAETCAWMLRVQGAAACCG